MKDSAATGSGARSGTGNAACPLRRRQLNSMKLSKMKSRKLHEAAEHNDERAGFRLRGGDPLLRIRRAGNRFRRRDHRNPVREIPRVRDCFRDNSMKSFGAFSERARI